MKYNNRLALLPSAQITQPSRDLQQTADTLERFCVEFGIERDVRFKHRTASVAFANGINLARLTPEGAHKFSESLKTVTLFSPKETQRLAQALEDSVEWESNWMATIQRTLASAPELGSPTLRLLAMAGLGLAISASHSDFAEMFAKHFAHMSAENQFLGKRLAWWSHSDSKSKYHAFVEFTAFHYPERPVELAVMCAEVDRALKVTRHAADPWSLELWLTHGWAAGREFVGEHRDACRRLIEEAPPCELSFCRQLYSRSILGTAAPDGTLRLKQATLQFFAIAYDGQYAQVYCQGEQPRTIAWLVFDYAFWMGIFSTVPFPDQDSAFSSHASSA